MLNKILKIIIGTTLFIFGAILILGFPRKEQKIITEVTIESAVETVYEFIIDDANMPKWIPSHQSTTKISGEEGKPGSKYEVVFHERGKDIKMIETITENVENRKFAFELEYPSFIYNKIDILLDKKDGATTLTEINSYLGKGIVNRAMFILMRKAIKKDKLEMYQLLKEAVEGE